MATVSIVIAITLLFALGNLGMQLLGVEVMRRDAAAERGERPFIVTSMRDAEDRRKLAGWVTGEMRSARGE